MNIRTVAGTKINVGTILVRIIIVAVPLHRILERYGLQIDITVESQFRNSGSSPLLRFEGIQTDSLNIVRLQENYLPQIITALKSVVSYHSDRIRDRNGFQILITSAVITELASDRSDRIWSDLCFYDNRFRRAACNIDIQQFTIRTYKIGIPDLIICLIMDNLLKIFADSVLKCNLMRRCHGMDRTAGIFSDKIESIFLILPDIRLKAFHVILVVRIFKSRSVPQHIDPFQSSAALKGGISHRL